MRISTTKAIEGSRVLYAIGEIQAASAWHPENTTQLQHDWQERILRELFGRPKTSTPMRLSALATEMIRRSGTKRLA